MNRLYGAILGDLCGQPYELSDRKGASIDIYNPHSHITDDTLMTLASAKSILDNSNIEEEYKSMGRMYDGDYYGSGFKEWLKTPLGTVGTSYGNGCLMRVSPFMYIPDSLPLIIDSVMCSHRHHISIESVMRLYSAYKYGRRSTKSSITGLRAFATLEVRADKTMDFVLRVKENLSKTHHCIRVAVMMGGDTDTNASIVGELSNFYMNDLTEQDVKYVESKLDKYQLDILRTFNKTLDDKNSKLSRLAEIGS